MNEELRHQRDALEREETQHYDNAAKILKAVQPTRGLVVDRKLMKSAQRELAQAEFAEVLRSSSVYQEKKP